MVRTGFCKKAHKVIFFTELDAKIALARRKWADKGEQRYYRCGNHYHLTSKENRNRKDEGVK